jgi:uncharacterized membrane protein YeaQ/YmgE (transglycosylase-associated protein family)
MKRRRELGPKKVGNRRALRKYLWFALLAAVVGIGLAFLAQYLLGLLGEPDPEKPAPLYQLLPGMIGIVTVITVLAFLFFGIRAYMMGKKIRHSIQSSRQKFK